MARQINDIVLTGNGLLVTFDDNFSQQLVWEYVDGVLSLTDGKKIIAESVLDEIKNKSTINLSSATVWSHLFGSYGKPLDVTSITTGSVTAASITATGSVTAASIAATGSVTAASLGVTGSITAASVAATGSVTAASLGVTGSITAASVEAANLIADSITLDVVNQDVKISRPAAKTLRIGRPDDSDYIDITNTVPGLITIDFAESTPDFRIRNPSGEGFICQVGAGGEVTLQTSNSVDTLYFGHGLYGLRYYGGPNHNNKALYMPDDFGYRVGNGGAGLVDGNYVWNTQATGTHHVYFGSNTSHFLFAPVAQPQDFEHVDTTGAVYVHSTTVPGTATDQYLRLLHDTTDAVIESGSGDITLSPVSGVVNLDLTGSWTIGGNSVQLDFASPSFANSKLRFWPESGGTNLYMFDPNSDGMRIYIHSDGNYVLYTSENTANTTVYLGATGTPASGLGIRHTTGLTTEENGTWLSKPHFSRFTEANTAVAASPNVLINGESGNVITNEGATAENHHDLPTAAAGLQYTFIVQDVDGIQVNAAAGDTIRIGGTVSASGGFVSSATIGNTITIVAINTTEWVATTSIGTWTFDV